MVNRAILALATALLSLTADADTSGEFEFGKRGHVLVPVSIGGAAVRPFVVDTAASQIVLDPAHFPSEAVGDAGTGDGQQFAHGAHGPVPATLARLGSLALWEIERQDQVAALMKMEHLTPGKEADFSGILGVPFLREYVVDFDFANRRIALREPADGLTWCDICRAASAVDIQPRVGGLPSVPVVINGRPMVALLDTGAAYSILNEAAARELGIATRGQDEAPVTVSITFAGATAVDYSVRPIGLPVFRALRLESQPAMILGIDFLRTGRMVLDLTGRKVWFEPTRR